MRYRVDSVSSSQDVELGSAVLYDVLPSSCPDHTVVSSNAYAAADTHQEEGEVFAQIFSHQDHKDYNIDYNNDNHGICV